MTKKGNKKGKKATQNGKLSSWVSIADIPNQPQKSELRRLTTGPASLALGGANAVVLLSSGATSAQEWATYSQRWTQARVTSMRVHIITPLDARVPSGGTPLALLLGTDRSGALTGVSAPTGLLALASVKYLSACKGDIHTYEVRAIDLEDQDYDPISSLQPRFSIQMYFDGGAGTPAAGWSCRYYIEYAVQFKGTR